MSKLLRKNSGLRNDGLEIVAKRYAVKTTDHIDGMMDHDAIAKQYAPDIRELKISPEEMPDPIGDFEHSPVKGLVHRYKDRVLLKAAHVCAVYCRFCFRREMVGPGADALRPDERVAAIQYIRDNKDVWEVILTGGDPLVLSPRQLSETLDELCAIEHVKVIRIHSRIPAADPKRVTADLCAALKREKAVYIAIHINHAAEITTEVETAFKMLREADCVLLSQSVLLKGVNDDAEILENLFRRLVELRVKPYYLHHPDLAPGTKHFRLSIKRGQDIMRKLLGRVSGIAQPHYMLDIPGGYGKIPIGPNYIMENESGIYTATDYQGGAHVYKDLMTNSPTEIRFYHLERQTAEQAMPGLIARAYETGRRIVVKAANDRDAEKLNENLWVYNPDAFIPHGAKKDGNADRQPVWITTEDENPNNADVLILAPGVESPLLKNFTLCCEILDGRDEEAASSARTRWKKYKDEGFTVTYWQQGAKGWEKKA